MANKRDLKKQIRYICGEIAFECLMTREYVVGTDPKTLNDLVIRTADLQQKSLKNATFSFDKTPSDFDSRKDYHKAANQYFAKAYKTFYTEFNKSVQEIIDQLNKAIPQSQRDLNKKIVNAK